MSASPPRPILADVNLWLATVLQPHPHHEAAIAWWRHQVLPRGDTVHFCRLTQLGLLRLLTNGAVMGSSVRDPLQAWSDYEALLDQAPVHFADEPQGLEQILRTATEASLGSPGLWTDAYLAAFAIAENMVLTTFDRGFRRFAGLRLQLLD